MDQIRHIISMNTLGSDSGIDGCASTTSYGSSSITTNQQINQPNTSNSEATSAIIDLSDIQEDIPLTDDDGGGYLVSDEEIDEHNSKQTKQPSSDSFEIVGFDDQSTAGAATSATLIDSPATTIDLISTINRVKNIKITDENNGIYENDICSPINQLDSENDHNNIVVDNLQLTDVSVIGDNENNKLFRRSHMSDRGRLASKEEKQRQNEEIVIMESSSVSSETGSWESVFPQRVLTEEPSPPIEQQKESLLQIVPPTTIDIPPQSTSTSSSTSLVKREIKELPDFSYSSNKPSVSSMSACFIDASSLMDDTELYASRLANGPHLPEVACRGPCPQSLILNSEKSIVENCNIKEDLVFSPTPPRSGGDDLQSPNLSDEQKLLHLGGTTTECRFDCGGGSCGDNDETNDIKDQFCVNLSGDNKQQRFSTSQDDGGGSSSRDEGIVITNTISNTSSSDRSIDFDTKFRQEQERRQGNFLFKNSGNLLNLRNNDTTNHLNRFNDNDNCSDLSLPSIYSTGSDYLQNVYETGSQYGDTTTTSDVESGFFPDTPHNSIIHIETPPILCSGNSDAYSVSTLPLRIPSAINDSSQAIKIPTKKLFKCDESAPIVSGGASIKDFTPKQCESPPVQRKTDNCPIISGGMCSSDFSDNETNTKPNKTIDKPKISALSTWIVDMSDCSMKSSGRRSSSSSSTTDNGSSSNSNNTNNRSGNHSIERCESASSHKSGMGFYVSLNDIKPNKSELAQDLITPKRTFESSLKKATGFYVDMSDSEAASRTSTPNSGINQSDRKIKITNSSSSIADVGGAAASSADKKNIFSMFIDFGEKKLVPKKELASFTSRLTSSLQKQKDLIINSSDTESVGSNDGNDKVLLRRTKSPAIATSSSSSVAAAVASTTTSQLSDVSKRHSWNTTKDKTGSAEKPSSSYSRSSSLTTADNGIMSILDKIPLISKTSSMSIDSPNSAYDDFTCSKSISSYSNNSNSLTSNSIHSSIEAKNQKTEIPDIMASSAIRKRRQDVKLNETFDKSSQGSVTDGILSKDSSPTTDTDDVTFQNDLENMTIEQEQQQQQQQELDKESKESVRNPIMETILETKETASPQKSIYPNKSSQTTTTTTTTTAQQSETHTMESLQATIEKQKLLLETVNEEVQLSSFVKLSDMDKPLQKFELHSTDTLSKSVGSTTTRIGRLFGDGKSSTTRNSWNTMSRSTGNNLTNLASSVENLKSLSRLFPHLSKEFSSSLPADIQIDDGHIYSKSPGNGSDYPELIHTDISCTSSLTSSFSRSGIDSADESSLSCRQPRRLGEDLLKMFLQEIATDVVIEVSGRRMRAHKCILRSRCQYFAAILAGEWLQNSGNVITLPGYSFGSVHFALCHIYSGAAHPPEGISLMELAALADLLGLEGLKEVTAHALRTNYCHNFHKPCSGCIDGILQVFPVTLNHCLDELYRKCLRWSCKYYVKVWPTRAFAQLPPDIIGRCKQHIVAHLTSETVLGVILDCDHLLTLLAPCRWAIGVENTVRDIIDTAHAYISDHFASLIASDGFLSLGHGQSWNISRLENLLLRTGSTLTPDQACRSYQRVTRLNAVLGARVLKISPPAGHHLHRIQGIDQQELLSGGGGGGGGNAGVGLNVVDDEEEMDWNPEFLKLVSSILSAVEQCLTRQCARAMRTNQWQRMDLDLRKKIQTLACLSDPSDSRRSRSQQSNKPLAYNSTVCSSGSSNSNRIQDLYQVKLAIQAHSKRTQDGYHHNHHQQQQQQPQYKASAQTQTNYFSNDKNIHANHDNKTLEREMVKVSKSSTRTHVPPDLIPTLRNHQQQKPLERPTSLGHRRSQSETIRTYKSSISVDATTLVQNHYNKSDTTATTTTTNDKQSHVSRLAGIKPRYLEPKVQQQQRMSAPTTNRMGVLKSTSNLSVKSSKNFSSTDSSTRNSSTTLNKRNSTGGGGGGGQTNSNKPKRINESGDMSRDSLASPAKQTNNKLKTKVVTKDFDISVDSLGDSLHSSLKTDKTHSQESLAQRENNNKKKLSTKSTTMSLKSTFSRSNPIINNNNNESSGSSNSITMQNNNQHHKHNQNNSNHKLYPNNKFLTSSKVKQSPFSLSCDTTAENSPSSVTTTGKTSRISSITSAVSSPRELFNSRRSMSTPHQTTNTNANSGAVIQPKKSFLSAKSREILAAKKNASASSLLLHHAESTKSVPGLLKEKVQMSSGVNKSSSTSNMLLNKRSSGGGGGGGGSSSGSFSTTLHLRKTAKLINGSSSNVDNNSSNQLKKPMTNNKSKGTAIPSSIGGVGNLKKPTTTNMTKKTMKPAVSNNKMNIKIETCEHLRSPSTSPPISPILPRASTRIESKLERSSTFCKETSDIPTSELQIIE